VGTDDLQHQLTPGTGWDGTVAGGKERATDLCFHGPGLPEGLFKKGTIVLIRWDKKKRR